MAYIPMWIALTWQGGLTQVCQSLFMHNNMHLQAVYLCKWYSLLSYELPKAYLVPDRKDFVSLLFLVGRWAMEEKERNS
jgi:hypothetical protein